MQQNTFNVRFIIQKGKLNRKGEAPIMARISVCGEGVCLSTHQTITPDRWSQHEAKTSGVTRKEKEINVILNQFHGAICARYNELFRLGSPITAEKLKQSLSARDNQSMRLLELYDGFLKDYALQVGHTTTIKTYGRYELVRNRLAEYLRTQYKLTDMPIADINQKFIKGFDAFMRYTYNVENNYAMKSIQKFKTVFQTAIDNGWVKTNPFAAVKLHYDKIDRGFLSQQELTTLANKEMPSKRLEQIRDIFVFSCYTGLAYVDIFNLTTDRIIKGDDGKMWIRTHRQKTDTPVDVPLLEAPKMILDKYEGKGAKVFNIPSNQKVNDYLKEIAAICGINQRVTFHLARHTFATTITLANGVPIETVSKMLGHTNIRTTEIYARITQTKISNDMEALAQKIDHKTAKRTCDITAS